MPRGVTPAQAAYLTALDAFLRADVTTRDGEFCAIWKREALRDVIAESGRDPDAMLAEVPLDPRGQQSTPRSNEKRRRHALRRRHRTSRPTSREA